MAKKVILKMKNINTKDIKSLKSFAALLDDLALLSFTCVGKDSFSKACIQCVHNECFAGLD